MTAKEKEGLEKFKGALKDRKTQDLMEEGRDIEAGFRMMEQIAPGMKLSPEQQQQMQKLYKQK